MAKGKSKPAVVIPARQHQVSDQPQKTFTSTKGVELQLKAVSQFKIDAMRTSREEVPPPTYEADVFGGGKEILPLDEEGAKNQGREKEWQEYQKAVHRENNEFGMRMNNLVLFEGVDVEVPDEDSEWQKTCEMLKLKVPSDPVGRKIFYINTELLGAPEDVGELMAAIFDASRFSKEVVDKMKATFRSKMEGQKNKRMAEGEVGVAEH